MSPRTLVQRARRAGLDRVAVTDHNVIDGALRAHDLDPQLVIVGEEIRCLGGCELIGLFLQTRIPPRLPIEEVAARIREQGGLVYAPHPFAYVRKPRQRASLVLGIADICEAFNARAFLPSWNRDALAAARERGMPRAASSDAHMAHELGRAWVEVDEFDSAAGLLDVLGRGDPACVRTGSPLGHLATLGTGCVKVVARGVVATMPQPERPSLPE
jgi:hypothetical protein